MSAIKRLAAFAAAMVMLTGAAGAAARYSTRAAEKGVFERVTTLNGNIIHLATAEVPLFGEGVAIVSMDVKEGDAVEAGDVIGTYTVVTHRADVVRAENEVATAKDDFDYAAARDEAEIERLTEQMEDAADPDEARICELKIRRMQIEAEQRNAGAMDGIAALEGALDRQMSAGEPRDIIAPMSGVITEVAEPGAFKSGESAASIYDPDKVIARVSDPDRLFKYGMEVELTLSSRGSQTAMTGTVVSADNVLPASLKSGAAYILFDTGRIGPNFNGASATGVTLRVEDAILVAPMAITYKDGRGRVQTLDAEGTVHTRYITRGGENNSDVWILSGVSEGDKLIVK